MRPVWKIKECPNCGNTKITLARNSFCFICKRGAFKKKMHMKDYIW
jgi:hypothetical protein